jgi:hypothetical protein
MEEDFETCKFCLKLLKNCRIGKDYETRGGFQNLQILLKVAADI